MATAINAIKINSPWNFTVKSEVRVDFGENVEIYLSQMSKIAFKSTTMVGENIPDHWSP